METQTQIDGKHYKYIMTNKQGTFLLISKTVDWNFYSHNFSQFSIDSKLCIFIINFVEKYCIKPRKWFVIARFLVKTYTPVDTLECPLPMG